jgi:hypothetical protein
MYLIGFVIGTHIRWDRMKLDKSARAAAMVIEPARLAHVIVLALEHERLGPVSPAAKALKIRRVHLADGGVIWSSSWSTPVRMSRRLIVSWVEER